MPLSTIFDKLLYNYRMEATTDMTATNITPPSPEEVERQISENYEAFSEMRFDSRDSGKFALLRDRELVEIMETSADAYRMGMRLYTYPGRFSIQEIDPQIIDLGFLKYALYPD